MRITIASLLLILSATLYSQTENSFLFTVKGEIRDKQGRVIPGLMLEFRNDAARFTGDTDINGRFEVRVGKGDYEVTVDPIPSDDFRLFVKITDGPLNPNYIELTVNSENVCSEWLSRYPKIQNVVTPKYPPAARAVRAFGDVSVKVTISSNGKVLTAEAISGHPLLRAAGRKAAEESLFESSDMVEPRTAILTYVFLDAKVEKPNLGRLPLPCRIAVNAEPIIVMQSQNR